MPFHSIVLHSLLTLLFVNNLFADTWVHTSGPDGGEVYCFAHHGDIVYAGTFQNGVFRSDDNGMHWAESNNGIEECEINALLTCSDSVFAASDDGLFLSADSGKTWMSAACDFNDRNVSALEIVGGTLLIATADGMVFRTSDGGVTWEKMKLQFSNDYIDRFTVHNDTVFASVMFQKGIYSPDKGVTWYFIDTTDVNRYVSDYVFDEDTIFVGDRYAGVFRFVAGEPLVNIGLVDSSITAMEIIDGTIFAGTMRGGVFRSEDGGHNWLATNDGLYGNYVYCLEKIGTTLFAGTQGGIFTLEENETVWTARNSGLRNARISSLCFYDTMLIAGTFSCGIFSSNDYGKNWKQLRHGIPERTVTDLHVFGNDLYAGVSHEGVYRLSGSDTTWEPLSAGLSVSYRSIGKLVNGGGYLFAGVDGDGVFRFDSGINNWITVNGEGMRKNIISLHATDGHLFAVGHMGPIYRSDDWGEQWSVVNIQNIGGLCLQIAHMENMLFASMDSGIFRSDDWGENWNRAGAAFSRHAIISLLVDRTTIFAGSYDNGVWISSDSGASWQDYNTGLSGRYIPALVQKENTLFAGLNSGIWYRELSDVAGIGSATAVQTRVSEGMRLRRIDRSTMQLTFTLSRSSPVTVSVYTMAGEIAQVLVDGVVSAGLQKVEWNTADVSAGMYIIRMTTSHATNAKTICLF